MKRWAGFPRKPVLGPGIVAASVQCDDRRGGVGAAGALGDAIGMTEERDVLQRVFSDALGPLEAKDLASALRSGDATVGDRLVDTVRRLSVLAKVADMVTQELSLDHQLPRLIELIADALDAERATLFLHDHDTGELFSRVV